MSTQTSQSGMTTPKPSPSVTSSVATVKQSPPVLSSSVATAKPPTTKPPPAPTSDSKPSTIAKTKYTLNDFKIDRTLGTGSFGRVHMVKLKSTGKYYAMKVLKKAEIVKMKQVEHTINEKNILDELDFPFLVRMLGTMQCSSNVYFVMEYVQGGELFSYLRRCGVS
jgi:hypothetical protein